MLCYSFFIGFIVFSHYFFTVFIELWPSSLLKEERMKINLVPNVSHDLKTPLASIIRYVDVLSKAEDLSQVFRDYVRILSEKSERLNNNVSDLFGLAKSTSGNISLDLETLALKNWWNRQLLIWMTASSHRVWWLSGTFLMSRFRWFQIERSFTGGFKTSWTMHLSTPLKVHGYL